VREVEPGQTVEDVPRKRLGVLLVCFDGRNSAARHADHSTHS
jgi:hypothetical protein